MSDVPYLNEEFIHQNNDFPKLIEAIHAGFAATDLVTPTRHHHEYSRHDTLLLMPAWQTKKDLGVKIISSNPNNAELQLPTINGLYIYMDINTGLPKAILDAKSLTTIRTAATSALAASLLARPDRKSMLMIGTGALAPALIKAHCSTSSISEVYIWGRDYTKAHKVLAKLNMSNLDVQMIAVQHISEVIGKVDLISTATYSQLPLVKGKDVKEGCHIDLVGSYKRDMREADDEAITKSMVFVDSYEGAMHSTGDLVIPIERGLITEADVKADLFELCQLQKQGRSSNKEITLFKSVGHGLEDLVAARYFFSQSSNSSIATQ